MGELKVIHVDYIKKPQARGSITVLTALIKQHGFQGCITVRKVANYYEIIDGARRYLAALAAGLATIPVDIVELDDEQLIEHQIMRSKHKVKTPPVEYAKQLKGMMARDPSLTLTDMAHKLEKPVSWIRETLSLNKLTPSIQTLVDANKIPPANAYALARLPHEEQQIFCEQATVLDPADFMPMVNMRMKELQELDYRNKLYGEPFAKVRLGHEVDAMRYALQSQGIYNEAAKLRAEGLKAVKSFYDPGLGEPWPSAYEMLHGAKIVHDEITVTIKKDETIIRKGWDQVVWSGQTAYCCGDILVYRVSGRWKIKHPVLQELAKFFFDTEAAMRFVEEHFA